MKSSGVFRKVDELGRIVIPVEIRKMLNIKVGENLEFFISGNKMILSKNNMIDQNIDLLKDIERSISNTIDCNYLITDREKILLASNKDYIDCKLDDKVINLLDSLDEYNVEKLEFISENNSYVFPYYLDNNKLGFIILYDLTDINRYIKMIKFIISYINNKLSIS